MTNKNYLIIESNVVANICVWDGNPITWQPPAGSITFPQEEVSAMVWDPVIIDGVITDYVLTKQLGAGQIGFTWDGTILTTNEPKPEIPPIA